MDVLRCLTFSKIQLKAEVLPVLRKKFSETEFGTFCWDFSLNSILGLPHGWPFSGLLEAWGYFFRKLLVTLSLFIQSVLLQLYKYLILFPIFQLSCVVAKLPKRTIAIWLQTEAYLGFQAPICRDVLVAEYFFVFHNVLFSSLLVRAAFKSVLDIQQTPSFGEYLNKFWRDSWKNCQKPKPSEEISKKVSANFDKISKVLKSWLSDQFSKSYRLF